ncbi:hypothetical protein GCM10027521_59630 [Amycolatopsis cihanbeyliensis]
MRTIGSEQHKHDAPTGMSGRTRSAASGLYKPSAFTPKKKARLVAGKSGVGVKTALAGRTGVRKPAPSAPADPAAQGPYPSPSFLGIFDLPADSSERVKTVVRGQDDD